MDGQVAVGEHTLRIHPEHGAVVTYAAWDARPLVRPRAAPARALAGDLPPLLGREGELHTAQGDLAPNTPVEVVGEPGIGKTALLRRLSHQYQRPGHVVFLHVDGHPGEDVMQMLFESFYEYEGAKVATAAELGRYLEDRQGLVVLDDEELPRQELGRLMSLAPACAFAIGAAERRLWARGRSIALNGLDEGSCLALAQRELARELSDRERTSLARLAQTLDGHPLRILQAAHLMIERSRPRSDRPAPSGSPKEQFDELVTRSIEDDEERALGPLAAFPRIALDAGRLAEITGVPDTRRMLSSLEERGLVQAHGRSYSLVGTAATAVARHTDAAAWRERTLEHYAGSERDLGAEEAPAVLSLLAAAAEAEDHGTVIRLARRADAPLALGSRWGAWREALERALSAARAVGEQPTEAWALHQLGSRAGCLGDLDGGTPLLNDALRLRESLGDGEGVTLTRDNLETLKRGAPPPSLPPVSPARPSAPPPPEPPPAETAPTPPPATGPPPGETAPTPPPATGPPPAEAAPTPAAAPSPSPPRSPPRRPQQQKGRDLPPLKPVLAALAALVVVAAIVLALTGRDDDSPSSRGDGDKAGDMDSQARERRARRGKGRRPRKRPQALPAVIQPRTLGFTARVAERSKPRVVRAENKGGARITLGDVRLGGANRRDFVVTDGCSGSTLSRGESCKVVVSFAPARRRGAEGAATLSAAIVFTDDGRRGRQTVALRARRLPG